MNQKYSNKILLIVTGMFLISSCTSDPTVIQLPDKTPPSGYIVNPIDGSSVSGTTVLQVIAIDNEEVDTVFFLIKAQSSDRYQSLDSTTINNDDIWKVNWDTRASRWSENENYFITFRAVDLVGNDYIAHRSTGDCQNR